MRGLPIWHTLATDAVLKELQVDPACGLAEAEAVARRWEYGANVLAEAPGQLVLLGKQFHRFHGPGTVRAAVVSFCVGILGCRGDLWRSSFECPVGIFPGIPSGEVLTGFERARPQARNAAGRNGTDHSGPGCGPGDILLLEAGDLVPADARLLEAISLAAEDPF